MKLLLSIVIALGTLATVASAQVVTQRIELKAFGGWARPNGDTDMDTNASDRVPASCTSRLFFSDSQVLLDLHFCCEELEGDQTRYQGDRTFTLFNAPSGKRITGVTFGNGSPRLPTVRNFHGVSKGTTYNLRRFRDDIAGSYWEKLEYRVDQPVHNDGPFVGVSGILAFRVTLADR